jgi:hypothetical protein
VLGDEARENGLKYSLLQRLQVLYRKCGGKSLEHIVFLNTNYRCHRDIVKIFNELLFYNFKIKMSPHDKSNEVKCPLVFVCSSVTSTVDPEVEAQLLLKQVKERCEEIDWRDVCLTTATRTQVYTTFFKA